ncbi:MAG TPA: hypothetical protein VMW20_10355 [Candidatus Nanoarchaeia archaeon]|nr:hypothetical protein [Candidatus Nanoarchaeia archaeon]
MKLNKRKIRYIINHKKKKYNETGKEPIIGKNLGRPKKSFRPEEVEIINKAFDRFKFGAIMLEPIIEGFYNIHIPHNRIHMYLLSEGLAEQNVKKKKRCKWIRYERKHSMSAGHID